MTQIYSLAHVLKLVLIPVMFVRHQRSEVHTNMMSDLDH